MKKAHIREINRINATIPQELKEKLIKKVPLSPTAIEIMKRALENPEQVSSFVSKEDLERYKAIIDSGQADIMVEVEDPEVAKLIDEHLNKEFEKARKLGRLPPPQKFPNLKNKAKKNYVREAKEHVSKGGEESSQESVAEGQ